uniref:Transmembrane protein 242 n=1 Tax=Timspurckia oligopyrenoides TaxID=708627 RepID=A0A7S0ZLF0_9RHOD
MEGRRDEYAGRTEEEPFQIQIEAPADFNVDEAFSPSRMAAPLLFVSGGLFMIGLMGGIPAGLAYGRAAMDDDDKKLGKTKKSKDSKGSIKGDITGASSKSGLRFAVLSFLYGTALCGAFGCAMVYGVHKYYEVNSIEEFVEKMRVVIPQKRKNLQNSIDPILNSIRNTATNTFPNIVNSLTLSFQSSYVYTKIINSRNKFTRKNETDDSTDDTREH